MGMVKHLHHEMIARLGHEEEYNHAATEYYERLKQQPRKKDRCVEYLRTTHINVLELVDQYISEAESEGEHYWYQFKTMADLDKDFEKFKGALI